MTGSICVTTADPGFAKEGGSWRERSWSLWRGSEGLAPSWVWGRAPMGEWKPFINFHT